MICFNGVLNAESRGRHALLIGIDSYGDGGFMSLQGAKNDIILIRDILKERFGFNCNDIIVLLDEEATHINIHNAFQYLAKNIEKDDFVYIHYSGHGSYTCDLNYDETSAWGMDSTWVPYGTDLNKRNKFIGLSCEQIQFLEKIETNKDIFMGKELNSYDILDDQIHGYLALISEKTGNIVFVSDSCHSGTITRGPDPIRTRAISMDSRPHPLGRLPKNESVLRGIRISASRDNEKAVEYRAGDTIYGMFTWFWAKSLAEAGNDDTWLNLFHRTRIRVNINQGRQTPQIQYDKDRRIFDGDFVYRENEFIVSNTIGNEAVIEAGELLGVTIGSVYKKSSVNSKDKVVINKVGPMRSQGSIKGNIKPGDKLVLYEYAPFDHPFKIFIRSEIDQDEKIKKRIIRMLSDTLLFQIVEEQSSSDIIIQIIRPMRDKKSNYASNIDDSLPDICGNNNPEAWVMTPAEELIFSVKDIESNILEMKENLIKIARADKFKRMSSAPGFKSPVSLFITIWCPYTTKKTEEYLEYEEKKYFKVNTIESNDDRPDLRVGQILTFAIYNESQLSYYNYLINITSEGYINPFFPLRYHGMEYGLLNPGDRREIADVMLYLDKPVREYIRLFSTSQPIDIHIIGQQGYRTIRGPRVLSPLEELLGSKSGLLRTYRGRNHRVSEWFTIQRVFEVTE